MVFIFTHNLNILRWSCNVNSRQLPNFIYSKTAETRDFLSFSRVSSITSVLILLPFQTVPGKLYFCLTIIKIYPVNTVWLFILNECRINGVMLLHCNELLSCVYGGINETESHQWDEDLNVTKFKAHCNLPPNW